MNMRFTSVYGLCRLPYFFLDKRGTLRLRQECITGSIDMHAHTGWNFLFAKPVDMKAHPPIRHFFPSNGVPVDLSHCSAYDFTPKLRKVCRNQTVRPLVTNKGYASTHTLSNLGREMTHMNVQHAVILAIDLLQSHNSEHILRETKGNKKFSVYGSVHPCTVQKEKRLKQLIKAGITGIKIHPSMQLVKPNHKQMLKFTEIISHYNLPILFHSGHSPLTLSWQRRYTKMKDYQLLIEAFPNQIFILGHAGLDAYKEACEIARKHDNVYLELSGQSVPAITYFIKHADTERVFFGSDWPYYPIALPLAKVLVATEKKPLIRSRILKTNAQRFLKRRR